MRSITPSSATTDSTCRAKRQQARLQGPQAIDFIHLQERGWTGGKSACALPEINTGRQSCARRKKSAPFGRDNREIA
jgi:hypothetical protein